jgi:2-amino-1-hydroxyethylphosphonate dioxygenase (glycine-forming)
MKTERAEKIAADIIGLYEKYGSNEYAGEKITQLEHMVQAAALAKQGGYDDEMILAAFLHDIGHICAASYTSNTMNGFGIINHEKIGAQFLRNRGFSERIARLVENHVSAKRYLTFKFPEYYEGLSEASKKTLEYQGGRMNPDEAVLFENDLLCEDFIEMRRWDELAKEENQPLQLSFEYFSQLIRSHLLQQKSVLTIA